MGQSILAKLSASILLCALISLTPTAEASQSKYVNQVVDAIYKAEGGSKTKHPYGILSIKVKGRNEARKACYEVVNWRYAMWLSSGQKESFIKYLSRSYCPVGALNDPMGLNQNWVKNVNYFMGVAR